MSLNIPHLLDSKGRPTPGSLIPFCAYNQAMSTLGKNLSGLTFPVCDQFKPVIKGGQVCYALEITDLRPTKKGKTKQDKGFGVWLVINMEMSSTENFFNPEEFLMYKNTPRSNRLTIHLSLLQEFTDVRAGAYGMTSLKKLTGTDTFLGLPDDVKDCQVGDQVRCENNRFIERVKTECGCIPWSLGDRYNAETFCSPTGLSCVNNMEASDEDCRPSCTGLHAVVLHTNNTKDEGFWQKFGDMEEEYKGYLNNYAENLEYYSSSDNLSEINLLNQN